MVKKIPTENPKITQNPFKLFAAGVIILILVNFGFHIARQVSEAYFTLEDKEIKVPLESKDQ